MGLNAGDRVMIVAESRPEWAIADLAVMAAGGISVPAYTTNTVADHLHLLADSGARAAIVSGAKLAANLVPALQQRAGFGFLVAMDDLGMDQSPGFAVHEWDAVLAQGDAAATAEIDSRVAKLRREDLACLIYTSGTGGAPKGVMLHHGAILCNCAGAHDILTELGLGEEIFLSFLPLSHAYEHTAGLFFPISIGAQIYYAESVEALAGNLQEVRPTIMTAVPRLYEALHARITRQLDKEGGRRAQLFNRAVQLGIRRAEGERLGFGEKLLDAGLDRLVRRKVAERFGGRLKAFVSGGAPLNYDVGMFFTGLGVRLLQGYGQTEAAPLISCNRPSLTKLRTVGPACNGVEVRIADDGEILVRGELVMQGYWNNPDATAEVLKDGWLHTGDIGRLDEDACIEITDRKKDLIVNSGGDNISPQRVEGMLTLQRELHQAMVAGDRKPYLVALVVPDPEFVLDWCRETGATRDLAELAEDEDFRKAIRAAIDRVNAQVSVIERVRRFAIVTEDFSVENGMMTPTMKIRRHVINRNFADTIAGMYGD
jgi:long-chain acyl-CoA synthetase